MYLAAAQLSISATSTGSSRQALASSTNFSRPARPTRQAHRPAKLVFQAVPTPETPDTPALSSPSASEASSRLSLETRLSEGGSFFSTSRLRPAGTGHTRQKSSQAVKIHPTIKEEPSIATLRAKASPNDDLVSKAKAKTVNPAAEVVRVRSWYADGQEDDDEEVMQQMKKWSELRHEADYECRRGKELWDDPRSISFMGELCAFALLQSDPLTPPAAEFSPPKTVRDIMNFLAKSQATYRPMEEQVQAPPPSRAAHRRKSSLSNCRSLTSPYGLPLPKPVNHPQRPKGSLQTKFERTNSANSATSTSSKFSFGPADDYVGRTPKSSSSSATSPFAGLFPELAGPPIHATGPSGIFSQFARAAPESPPPSLPNHEPFSPFHFDLSSFHPSNKAGSDNARDIAPVPVVEEGKRERVNSSARRKALGWGRRRNSDGPAVVEGLTREVRGVPSRVKVLKAESNVFSSVRTSNSNINTITNMDSGDKRFGGVSTVAKLLSPKKRATGRENELNAL